MTPDHDPLAPLLAAARIDLDAGAVAGASVDLARSLSSSRQPGRLRRRMITITVTAVALIPTTAAAYVWTTHTGWFGRPDLNTEDVDASEILDLCAPDFRSVADRLAPPSLPLPEGLTLPMVQEALFAKPDPDCSGSGALTQATGISERYEAYARCSWYNAYLNDPAARPQASRALKALANSELTKITDGGGVQAYHNQIADAAAAGDVEAVRHDKDLNCGDFGWRR